MRFGSVCSGIEAASVAWNPLGWKAAWVSEIEPFPSTLLAHHYPSVPNLGDMTTLPERILRGEVEAPEVLCGGTPCQAFSVAGLRKSLDDARGNLSLVFCEIANAIDDARFIDGDEPAVVFWENVPGVLNTKDNAFGCFLAGLAGEAEPLVAPGGKWTNAGYVLGPQRAIAWRILDAQYFGVAQRRRRVFVVASARDGFDPAAILFEFYGVRRDTAPSREPGQEVTGTIASRTSGGGFPGSDEACSGFVRPVLKWPQDISPTINAHFGEKQGLENQHIDGGAGMFVPAFAIQDVRGLGKKQNGCGWNSDGVAYTVDTHATQGVAAAAVAFAQNTREEVRLCNGDGLITSALSAEQGTHQTPRIAYTTKLHNTTSNNAGKIFEERTVALDASSPPPALLTATQVRRLTPSECERLQGFPDDYTNIPWTEYQRLQRRAAKAGASYEAELRKRGKELRGKPVEDCPDGPRYKALGNSWAVPNVRWIGQRIDMHLLGLL